VVRPKKVRVYFEAEARRLAAPAYRSSNDMANATIDHTWRQDVEDAWRRLGDDMRKQSVAMLYTI
jgi:hypothetical protein